MRCTGSTGPVEPASITVGWSSWILTTTVDRDGSSACAEDRPKATKQASKLRVNMSGSSPTGSSLPWVVHHYNRPLRTMQFYPCRTETAIGAKPYGIRKNRSQQRMFSNVLHHVLQNS